jgi:P27 family predicted phage terminase small subunit
VQPPRWLGVMARNEWHRIVPELERLGFLTVIDLGTLEIYCDLYERWRRARVESVNGTLGPLGPPTGVKL